jgi:hypothetical protein
MKFRVKLDLDKIYKKYAIFTVGSNRRLRANGERLELIIVGDIVQSIVNSDEERVSVEVMSKDVSTIGC